MQIPTSNTPENIHVALWILQSSHLLNAPHQKFPIKSYNSFHSSYSLCYRAAGSLWMEVSTISAMAFSIILTISSATELDNAAFSVPVIIWHKHFLGTLSLMLLVAMLFGNPWAYIRGLLLHLLGFLTFLLFKKWGHCIFCANFTNMSCFSYLNNEMCNQILFVRGVPNCPAMIECTE